MMIEVGPFSIWQRIRIAVRFVITGEMALGPAEVTP